MAMTPTRACCLGLLLLAVACSEETGEPNGDGGGGTPLAVAVNASGKTFVDLTAPAVVTVADPLASYDWDVAFEGYDVFTNSGASGPGLGGAFGPLDPEEFDSGERPPVPFLFEDGIGGAFVRWWAYDSTEHVLYSRFHVYGLRDGDRLFKVQILSYYGEVAGAPVRAIYRLRWAEVTPGGGVMPTQELSDMDGTAGGVEGAPDAPSECLDLASGSRQMLSPAAALASSDWHLCFRRDTISVNGELGGPRGTTGVDVDRARSSSDEPLDVVMTRTAESELMRFEAETYETLADPALVYRGDRVVSVFETRWFAAGAPRTPRDWAWMVEGPDGAIFVLKFDAFEGATPETPGLIQLRVKTIL
jgi:hypothetical protein